MKIVALAVGTLLAVSVFAQSSRTPRTRTPRTTVPKGQNDLGYYRKDGTFVTRRPSTGRSPRATDPFARTNRDLYRYTPRSGSELGFPGPRRTERVDPYVLPKSTYPTPLGTRSRNPYNATYQSPYRVSRKNPYGSNARGLGRIGGPDAYRPYDPTPKNLYPSGYYGTAPTRSRTIGGPRMPRMPKSPSVSTPRRSRKSL